MIPASAAVALAAPATVAPQVAAAAATLQTNGDPTQSGNIPNGTKMDGD